MVDVGGTFERLKASLEMDAERRIMMGSVPVIMTPRHFFANIQKFMEEAVGLPTAARIYYKAGYESGHRFSKSLWEMFDLRGRAVLERYLDSVSWRGWGRFELAEMDEGAGRALIRVYHSAFGQEYGNVGRPVCIAWPGSFAGSVAFILEQAGKTLPVRGREVRCAGQGDPHCEVVVEAGS